MTLILLHIKAANLTQYFNDRTFTLVFGTLGCDIHLTVSCILTSELNYSGSFEILYSQNCKFQILELTVLSEKGGQIIGFQTWNHGIMDKCDNVCLCEVNVSDIMKVRFHTYSTRLWMWIWMLHENILRSMSGTGCATVVEFYCSFIIPIFE